MIKSKYQMSEDKLELIAKLAKWLFGYLLLSVVVIVVPVIIAEERVYVTFFVFSSGVIGGCLSIQQRIKVIDIDELKLYTKSLSTLILFPLTGGVLALLLYVTFLSGIIQGHLFPNFYMPDFGEQPTRESIIILFKQTVPETGQDFCKVLFWSFVAGFSERFVIKFIYKASDDIDNNHNKPSNSTG